MRPLLAAQRGVAAIPLVLALSALSEARAEDPAGVDPADAETVGPVEAPRDPSADPEEAPPGDPPSAPEVAAPPEDPAAIDDEPAPELDPSPSPDPVDAPTDPADLAVGRTSPLPPLGGAPFTCPEGTALERSGDEAFCLDTLGRRHGPWARYFEGGALAARGSYLHGRRHGRFEAFFPTGALEGRSHFQHGLEEGLSELWYPSGQKKSETQMRGGLPDGRQVVWYENGTIRMEGHYQAGERHGAWTWYDEDGRVIRSATYVGGEEVDAPKGPARDAASEGPDRFSAALAGGIGAGAGVVLGVPATLVLLRLRVFQGVDPDGWLLSFVLPPLATGLGAALGLLAFTSAPAALVGGMGAALVLPVGAVTGLLIGVAAGACLALVVGIASGFRNPSEAREIFVGSIFVGGAVGAVALPSAVASGAGWIFARPPEDVE